MRRICPHCRGSGYIAQEEDRTKERIQAVLAMAAMDWAITMDELTGPCRKKEYVQARRHVAQELRSMGLHLKEIGRVLGNRDHSTVINLLKGEL